VAVFTPASISAIVYIILAVATNAAGGQADFLADRSIVALDTADVLMLTVQLETGLVMVEIQSFQSRVL